METRTVVALLSMIASIVPTVGYTLLVWWLDRYEKEPLALLAVAFAWGAVPAVVLSFLVEAILNIPLSNLHAGFSELASGSIMAPIVEEAVKAVALWSLYFLLRSEFDDVLDGIVYGALIGFGFGMTENVAYFVRSFSHGGWLQWASTVLLRSTVFGLTHAFYTALVGAGLGYARLAREPWKRRWLPFIGLAAAIFFHAVHNASLTICPGLLATIFSDWMGILVILALIVLSWRREKLWIVTQLAAEVPLGVLSASDYMTLSSHRHRVREYLRQWRQRGWSKARRWQRLTQEATELAFRKDHLQRAGHDPMADPIVARTRTHILALRKELGRLDARPLVCRSCGHPLRTGNRFCTRCGQPVGESTTEENPASLGEG